MNRQQPIVVIDWGTSNLRAYLCNAHNRSLSVIDKITSQGVCKSSDDYERQFLSCIQPWANKYGQLRVLITGQIGSSIGWKQTPYLPCESDLNVIAENCVSFRCEGHEIYLLPGLSCELFSDHFDVLRGEEVQILGWLAQQEEHNQGEYLLCLPGTHTKWVHIVDGIVQQFKSALTGELYDLLCHGSVLIQSNQHEFNPIVFDKGATFTLTSPLGSFSHGLISVRSAQLFGKIAPEHAASYLSGMLIGSDVRAAINATEWNIASLPPVAVIGEPKLMDCFTRVLNLEQISAQQFNTQTITIAGFSAIYHQLFSYD